MCARLGDIKMSLRWRTVLEIRARSHGAPATSTTSTDTGVRAPPNSLSLSLMHKYKQVLDEDCRVSSKCTCYAKTAGPLMRANYFRKQQLSCLKMCDVFGARVCAREFYIKV